MDARRSFYLASRQDDFDMPAQDNEGWVNFTERHRPDQKWAIRPRRGRAPSFRCPAQVQLAVLGHHDKVVRAPYQAASQELIAKLIAAGYLQPALRDDADAITTAITRRCRPARK